MLQLSFMKPTFPIPYSTTIERTAPARAHITAGARPVLVGGPPPEFQGDEQSWTPEHLLLASLGLCLFTTFEAFAAREKLTITAWRDRAHGTIDRTSSGLAFTKLGIEVDLVVAAQDEAKVREVFDKAKKNCIVSRALSPSPEVALRVEAIAPAA